MEDAEPGIPTSTAAIKDPETPPTYMPINMAKLISVFMAKVMGSSSVIPRPPERPGIAPRTQPTSAQAYITKKFAGCRRIPNAWR